MKATSNIYNKNYAGIDDEYAKIDSSKIILIPVPFDATSTWGKGADKGPVAFLEASENMEIYDIESNSEPYRHGIHVTAPIAEKLSPDIMVIQVYDSVKEHLQNNKFVTLFGGEHSISMGSIRAFGEHFEDITILQLDAHTDLRKSYEGSPFNHACALHEASLKYNLIQVGIRSMDSIEFPYLKEDKVFYAKNI